MDAAAAGEHIQRVKWLHKHRRFGLHRARVRFIIHFAFCEQQRPPRLKLEVMKFAIIATVLTSLLVGETLLKVLSAPVSQISSGRQTLRSSVEATVSPIRMDATSTWSTATTRDGRFYSKARAIGKKVPVPNDSEDLSRLNLSAAAKLTARMGGCLSGTCFFMLLSNYYTA